MISDGESGDKGAGLEPAGPARAPARGGRAERGCLELAMALRLGDECLSDLAGAVVRAPTARRRSGQDDPVHAAGFGALAATGAARGAPDLGRSRADVSAPSTGRDRSLPDLGLPNAPVIEHDS